MNAPLSLVRPPVLPATLSADELRAKLRQFFNEHASGWEVIVVSAHNGRGALCTLDVHCTDPITITRPDNA